MNIIYTSVTITVINNPAGDLAVEIIAYYVNNSGSVLETLLIIHCNGRP